MENLQHYSHVERIKPSSGVNDMIEHAHEYVSATSSNEFTLNKQGTKALEDLSKSQQGNLAQMVENFGRTLAWVEFNEHAQSSEHPQLSEKLSKIESTVVEAVAKTVFKDVKDQLEDQLTQHGIQNPIDYITKAYGIEQTEENQAYYDTMLIYEAAQDLLAGNLSVENRAIQLKELSQTEKNRTSSTMQSTEQRIRARGGRRWMLATSAALLLAACAEPEKAILTPTNTATPEPTQKPLPTNQPEKPTLPPPTSTPEPVPTIQPPEKRPTLPLVETAEVKQERQPFHFGKIELGNPDGTPGKPTVLFIQTADTVHKIFFLPKRITKEDINNDYYDYKLPYNITITDGSQANIQTVHSGSAKPLIGHEKKWPAEEFVRSMRDKEGSTQEALSNLLQEAKKVVIVQGELTEGITNYSDPIEVEEKINSLDITGIGFQNPVIQDAELVTAYRFDSETTKKMEETFLPPPSRLTEYMQGEQAKVQMEVGDLYFMMCDRVDESMKEKAMNNYSSASSQARIILGLKPIE